MPKKKENAVANWKDVDGNFISPPYEKESEPASPKRGVKIEIAMSGAIILLQLIIIFKIFNLI